MDVELYVYDLSQGLARQVSLQLTGVHIEAIYHTAIVLNNVEYFFGQGIHRKLPASTHHGRPIEIIKLGRTELPFETIEEYIESLASIYTPETYDLFLHNCNHFSQDLAVFLVGKGIPQKIRDLPETFLRTPMGQMLRIRLDQSMRRMTQAPNAAAGVDARPRKAQANSATNGRMGHASSTSSPVGFLNGKPLPSKPGQVFNTTSQADLDQLLQRSRETCAIIFFTSTTCSPCKIVYPAYDELAAEAGGKAVLIKVNINNAFSIASKYGVRVTPMFMTFLKGKKQIEWTGANEQKLRQEVQTLLMMAAPSPHRHASLRLPHLQRFVEEPVMYKNMPPLEKLMAKMMDAAEDSNVQQLLGYIKTRERKGLREAVMPEPTVFSDGIVPLLDKMPSETRFALVDLVRLSAVDPRITSLLLAQQEKLLLRLLRPMKRLTETPYNLQVVVVQLACNLFGSNLVQEDLLKQESELRAALEHLASETLLAPRGNVRALASALVYNLAAYDHNERLAERPDRLKLSDSGDLEAALVQAVLNETESKEALHGLLLALGLMLYGSSQDSSVYQLCSAIELQQDLKAKKANKAFQDEPLLKEIGDELLGKGFRNDK